MLHTFNFSVEKLVISNFSMKNRGFYRFFTDFSSNRLSVAKIFFVSANNRFFYGISGKKSDFFVHGRSHVAMMSRHWMADIICPLELFVMLRHFCINAFPSLADVVTLPYFQDFLHSMSRHWKCVEAML